MVTTVLVLSSILSYHNLRHALYAQYEESKQSVSRRLQSSLPNALWNFDDNQIQTLLASEVVSPEVASIRLYQVMPGKPGEIGAATLVAERARKGLGDVVATETERLAMVLPSTSGPRSVRDVKNPEIGYADVSFSRQRVDALLYAQVRDRILEIVFLNFVLGLVLFFVMSRMVISPLSRLAKAFKDLADNPKSGELDVKGDAEFGVVVAAFNHIERRLVNDLHSRVQTEQKLLSANEELTVAMKTLSQAQESLLQSEKFASLGSLVAGVAHEINTPVGVAVTGASYLLQEAQKVKRVLTEGTIKKSEMLHFINTVTEGTQLVLSNVERASHLIKSFKQVAADETSEVRRAFNLKSYLDEVLTSLAPRLRKPGVRVRFFCPEDVVMDTFPGLLAQVVTNLVTNALKHGFDDDHTGEVSISAWVEGDHVALECVNDGKLIASEHLEKVFEPFFTTRRSDGGTGLGLSIVYNIVVQRLGGTIEMVSQVDKGTVFSIRIPRVWVDKRRAATRTS